MALNLKAHVSMDGSGFENGIRRLEHVGKEAFSELKQFALASFGVYGVERMFEKSITDAKELVSSAQRLGTDGVEGLQVMRQATEEANAEFEKMQKFFEKIASVRAKALAGDAGAIAALARIGIKDPKTSTEAMIRGGIHDLALNSSPATFRAAMESVIGEFKGLGKLIPVLKTDFDGLQEHMERMGTIMSTDVATKLKVLGSSFELLSKILVTRFGEALLNMLSALADGMQTYLDFIDHKLGKDNQEHETKGGPGFFSKLGYGAAGIGTGLLSIWDLIGAKIGIPGQDEQSQKRIDQTNAFFRKSFAWMSGGVLSDVAEEAAKAGGKGPGGRFREFIEELKKEANRLKASITNPIEDMGEMLDKKAEKKSGRIDSADSLVRVGNFLGDSQGSLVSIAERHLAETKAMHNTLKTMRGGLLGGNATQQDPAFA